MLSLFLIFSFLSSPYQYQKPQCGGYRFHPDSLYPGECQTFKALPGETAILYLNFEGATITKSGGDDPKLNMSWIPDYDTVEIPPFDAEPYTNMAPLIGRQEVIDAIVGIVRHHYAEFNIIVTTERPPDTVTYQMMMVGGHASLITASPGAMVGVSPMDCGNMSKSDVSFTFSEDLNSIEDIATTIAHEAGHSFGLAHVGDPKAIMNPYVTSSPTWMSGNVPDGQACDGSNSQDSAAVLGENLGIQEDVKAPWVDFLLPGKGAVSPRPVQVQLITGDLDSLGIKVELFVDGTSVGEKDWPFFNYRISNIDEGKHNLKAVVTDGAGNSSSTEITITVEPDCVSENSCFTGKSASVGSECRKANSCNLGTCVISNDTGEAWCSTECLPDTSSCALGMKCLPVVDGTKYYCGYGEGTVKPKTNSDDHELGCSVSGRKAPPLWLLFVFGFLILRKKYKNI